MKYRIIILIIIIKRLGEILLSYRAKRTAGHLRVIRIVTRNSLTTKAHGR